MRKLLFAGAVLAAPLLAWQPARAAVAAPLDSAAVTPSASVQKAAWVWVGGRRVWHSAVVVRPGWGYGYRAGWGYGYRPGWGYGYRAGWGYGYHPGWGYAYHAWHPVVRGRVVVRHWG